MNRVVLALMISSIVALFVGSLSNLTFFSGDKDVKRGFTVDTSILAEATSSPSAAGKVIELGMLLAESDVEAGKKVAVRCMLCHTMDKGGNHKVGPNLWGVVDSNPASKSGFEYSSAMKNNKDKWTFSHLYHFVNNPSKIVPGTKMAFAGVKNQKELVDLLAYLATLNDGKIALPPKDLKINE